MVFELNFKRPLVKMMPLLAGAALISACATPLTGEQIEVKAAAIHADALVIDAHADIVLPATNPAYIAEDGTSKVSLDKLQAGGIDAVVMAIAVGPGPRTPEGDVAARKEADEKLAAVRALVASSGGNIVMAKTADDIRRAEAADKKAFILGFQNARALQREPANIDLLYAEGVRVFGLNHLAHNDFSDSSRPNYIGETSSYEVAEEHGGLSPLGVAAIRRINAMGGIVDVSQMSKAATLQAIQLSTAPVIASHSNARAVSNVTRNLSDEEIDRIGETGGVIHVAAFGAYLVALSDPNVLAEIKRVRLANGLPEAWAYPYELYWELDTKEAQYKFLGEMRNVIGAGSISDMIAHIDYIAGRIGIDHVGIGNDFNHGSNIDGYGDASEALNLTIALVEAGYTEAEIKKIWGENFLRVLEKAEQNKTAG